MAKFSDFPVELVARVFEGLDIEDAWTARQVCRHWRDIFDLCAYGSRSVYFSQIRVGIDVICGIRSNKGNFIDRHFIHGDVCFESNRAEDGLGKLIPDEIQYEYWPGGRWRKYEVGDALTELVLHFQNIPSNSPDLQIRLGSNGTLAARMNQRNDITCYVDKGNGRFNDWFVFMDTVEEPLFHGKSYFKHSITGLQAPLWQIFALLVRHIRTQQEKERLIHLHYIRSATPSPPPPESLEDSRSKEYDGFEDYNSSFGGYRDSCGGRY
jgi:F-box domain